MKTQVTLARGERIVAVVPEYCNGPGWSNAPLWVHIVGNDGTYREECIQPAERNAEQHTLFAIGERVAQQLIASVTTRKAKT